MIFSLILAYGATVFRGDPVVICIGMNLLASGLTAYLLRQMFGVSGTFTDPAIVGLDKIRIAALQAIPVLGWGFGRQTVLTWLAWFLVVAIAVVLFRTPIGLRLRGVGEQPDAAETLGVNVRNYRVVTVLVAGALCGLAGAQLSLGTVDLFAEDMSAGRGWIAVVAVMLARDNPALRCRRLRALRLCRRAQHPPAERGPAEPAHRHGALCRDARRAGHQPSPPHARRPAVG